MYISNYSRLYNQSNNVYNYTLASLTIQQHDDQIASLERIVLLVLISLTIAVRGLVYIRQICNSSLDVYKVIFYFYNKILFLTVLYIYISSKKYLL